MDTNALELSVFDSWLSNALAVNNTAGVIAALMDWIAPSSDEACIAHTLPRPPPAFQALLSLESPDKL